MISRISAVLTKTLKPDQTESQVNESYLRLRLAKPFTALNEVKKNFRCRPSRDPLCVSRKASPANMTTFSIFVQFKLLEAIPLDAINAIYICKIHTN